MLKTHTLPNYELCSRSLEAQGFFFVVVVNVINNMLNRA